jgi:hypothetical protein
MLVKDILAHPAIALQGLPKADTIRRVRLNESSKLPEIVTISSEETSVADIMAAALFIRTLNPVRDEVASLQELFALELDFFFLKGFGEMWLACKGTALAMTCIDPNEARTSVTLNEIFVFPESSLAKLVRGTPFVMRYGEVKPNVYGVLENIPTSSISSQHIAHAARCIEQIWDGSTAVHTLPDLFFLEYTMVSLFGFHQWLSLKDSSVDDSF